MSTKATFEQALILGHCDVVDRILGEGYIPEPSDIDIVCRNGNVDLLTKLLRYPIDIRNINDCLFTAVLNKQHHLLDHLFLAGVDINLPDEDGATPLHWVNDVTTCKWLLDMGARQITNNRQETPLKCALVKGKENVVKVLLSQEQGIQTISQSDSRGYTALHWACRYGLVETVRLLLSYEQGVQTISAVSNNTRGFVGSVNTTPLLEACRNSDARIVKLLLVHKQGVQNISFVDNNGETALFQACRSNCVEIVSLLLRYGQGTRSICIKNSNGETPLSQACVMGDANVVGLLLSHVQGLQAISMRNNNGETPLFKACYYARVDVVRLLLCHEQGVQTIFIANDDGETPLHRACYEQNVAIIELILSHVSPNKIEELLIRADGSGTTPMTIAKEHPKVMAVLDKKVFGCVAF